MLRFSRLPSEIAFGRYSLLTRIASGGMAELFLARQTAVEGFEKFVAIKRILPERSRDPKFVQLFLNEARLAARLSHPNIVQIYDLGTVDDAYFLAMEYVSGENLATVESQVRARGERLPIPLVIKIGVDLCQGLYYAHHLTDPVGKPLNVVHCDISPQNVIIGYDGAVKLVDFGIAHATQGAGPATEVRGKAAYMAPEQVRGALPDHATDLFALGVVLYEILTGRSLFKRADHQQTIGAVLEAPIPPPRLFVSDVPPALEAAILKTLERDPARRYTSARDLQQDLERALAQTGGVPSSTVLGDFMKALFAESMKARVFSDKTHTAVIPLTTSAKPAPTVMEALPRSKRRAYWPWLIATLSLATALTLLAPKLQPTPTPQPAPTLQPTPTPQPQPTPQPTPQPQPQPRKPRLGTISITTEPWTNVSIDGKSFGPTPVQQVKLPVGSHKLSLDNPKLELKQSVRIEVDENHHRQHRFLLEKKNGAWIIVRHLKL